MSRCRFPWVLVIAVGLAGALALPPMGRANDEPAPPEKPKEPGKDGQAEEKAPAIQLPVDTRHKRKLEAAGDYIKEQAWREAARVLQSLLDAPEDAFVLVPGKDGAGKPVTTPVSVRAEANRLLASMPRAGRWQYEDLYGAAASALLYEGQGKNNADLLAQAARRFLYTRAGSAALRLLASHHLVAGNFAMAANSFAGLIDRLEPEEWTAEMLFEATRAFRRAGDKERAERTWKEFQKKGEQGRVQLDGRIRTVAEWEAELDKLPTAKEKDWPVYRGDPSRSNEGSGDKPFLEKDWSHGTIREAQTKTMVGQAVRASEGRGQPILPSFFPVAVGGQVVYRDYWGVRASDLRTGQPVWESDSRYSLDRLFDTGGENGSRSPYANAWAHRYIEQMGRPGMLFENSVVGTLSTDAVHVYAVEDLYVPPPGPFTDKDGNIVLGPEYPNLYGPLRDAVFANKLNAYALRNGKLLWEISAQPEKEGAGQGEAGKDANEESYFLGPPLPLHGKLYVQTQRNQTLRLLCLDPYDGTVQWSQPLATTQTRLSQEGTRRTWAAHLSYGEGVLVCPTNAGMILGVDEVSHTVIWAHLYREKERAAANEHPGALMWRGRIIVPGRGILPTNPANTPEWKVTAPVVQDGRVVFTAPDDTSVRCLNLSDGKLVWKASGNDDDLYLAGAARGKVLIVGKKVCRALSLADGSKLWQVATGVPSGQGVFSGRFYYLPLKEGREKEPEVCVLNVDKGKDVAHVRSRKQEVPGNLLLYEDHVVSQTVEEVAAFPQLRAKQKEITARINKDPNDPVGLVHRADLRLADGDLAGAIADLRAALKNDPPPELRAKARSQLYEALTDYLRDDFDVAEKYLAEYRDLCAVAAGPDATPENLVRAEKDTERRRAKYRLLLGQGREHQGNLVEALRTYLEIVAQTAPDELISPPDVPAVKAAADVWAQGRIRAMLDRATPAQRRAVTDEIARQWQAVRDDKHLDNLETFVRLLGSVGSTGREARLLLGERLLKAGSFLEAERHFLILARTSDDRATAARATEALGRLALAQGLFDDALFWYRALGGNFPDVVVRDGKTGAEFLKDLATDKRLLPYLDDRVRRWRNVRVTMQTENGQFQPGRLPFLFEPGGTVLPSFHRHQVALDQQTHKFQWIDRETGEVRWQAKVTATQFFNFTQPGQLVTGQMPRYNYRTVGHIIVLPVGHLVFGIDPVGRKVLWEKSLLSNVGPPAGGQVPQVIQDPKDGTVEVLYADGWRLPLGQSGPAEPAYVCLTTRAGLHALDPVSGRTLWIRPDVRPNAHVFGDERYVYSMELPEQGSSPCRVFRGTDGATVKDVPDFDAVFQHRKQVDGHRILAAENRSGTLLVHLYDILSGKDVWKKECPAGSLMVDCEEPHQGAVLEPDGTLTALDLASGREVLATHVEAQDVERTQGATLLQDETQFYLAINGPREANMPWAGAVTAFQPGTGPRCVPVNGKICAFDRQTGKVLWATLDIPQQMLVVDQFRDLPVLLLTSRSTRAVNGRFGFVGNGVGTALTVVDKHTGKYFQDEHDLPNTQQQQFHTFRADLREGKIELIGFNLKVTLTLQDRGAGNP
jgi:outer membrane protein assembly factor BamB/tetratricopeptide (TPR) repeat protein